MLASSEASVKRRESGKQSADLIEHLMMRWRTSEQSRWKRNPADHGTATPCCRWRVVGHCAGCRCCVDAEVDED